MALDLLKLYQFLYTVLTPDPIIGYLKIVLHQSGHELVSAVRSDIPNVAAIAVQTERVLW